MKVTVIRTTRWAMLVTPFALSAWILFSGCSERPPVKKTWLPMGTFATLTLPGPATDAHVEHCFNAVTSLVSDIEQSMSPYMPSSDASRLNNAAGSGAITVSEHTRRTLASSLRYAQLSGGAFDPTVAPLVNLWGFNKHTIPSTPPSDTAIHAALQTVGFRNIVLSNSTATLSVSGMTIDFGGIAKGYAVDRCFEDLARCGTEHFMIDIGGNLRVQGESRPGRSWKIGVRDPLDTRRIIGTILLPSGMALATSGNYERFVTIEGRRYAHIIDPRTGTPVEGMAGVTVLCPSAVQADAMSTALFVLGPENARSLLASMPECHALFIPDTTPVDIIVTPGMATYFTPLPSFSSRVREMGEI